MARPTKSAAVTVGHFTSGELNSRLEGEEKLRGAADRLRPPSYLTREQKKIFRFIADNLKESGILGNLDVYVLTECCISIDRMQKIEQRINENAEIDPTLVTVKEKYVKIFFRCCNELSLSPQSRAKLANMGAKSEQRNPLEAILAEEDDE